MKTKLPLILFIALISREGLAQPCEDFLRPYRNIKENGYTYDDQSRAAFFMEGDKSTLNIVLYEGKQYMVFFYASSSLNRNIHVKVTDEGSNTVLANWDGAQALTPDVNGAYPRLSFYPRSTLNLAIEVSVPEKIVTWYVQQKMDQWGNYVTDSVRSSKQANTRGCMGVAVYNKPAEKLGF